MYQLLIPRFKFLMPILQKILLIVLFSFQAIMATAQYTQTTRGTVIDKESRQPLAGVRVTILGTNPVSGGVTDSMGRFKINNVSIGRHDFKISLIGYLDAVIPDVEVNSGKECILNIELEEIINQEAVVIKGEKIKRQTAE